MDVITYALAKKMGGGGESITYTLTADTENKTIVLTPSRGTAQVITVPYATDASTVNGHEVPELENGKIPANYLPSFVDNVDEYDNISLFPVVGESNRIYIDKSTNKTYRWSGTAYVEISESIALGETSSTAYRGDRGKIAYDHSQSAHAPSNAEANQNAFSNVKIDSDIINASAKTDTLEFIAGDNIILTPNVSNKKITVSQVPVRATASGDIASFSDGAGYPFLKVKANITPVQDLHGYEYPWVGGAGKNKFNKDGVVYNNGKSLDANGDKIANESLGYVGADIEVRASANYTISGLNAIGTTSNRIFYFDSEKNFISRSDIFKETTSFTTPSNCAFVGFQYLRDGFNSSTIQLELGSSATSFAPYSNICPISGFTGVNVAVTGVNIWDEEWEQGYYDASGAPDPSLYAIRSKNYISVKPSTTYYIHNGFDSNGRLQFYDANKNWIGTSTGTNKSFTTADNCYFIKFSTATTYGGTYNNDISINYPSTDTSYHAYNSNSHVYSISWQDEAGIVYGGYIDLVSGVLTKVLDGVDLGTLSWSKNDHATLGTYFYGNVASLGIKATGDYSQNVANAICSNYTATRRYVTVFTNGTFCYDGSATAVTQIQIKDSNYSDATAFATAMNGVQLVYELATPQTYQLTPQQINTLIGQNNVWNDVNGQTEVEYKAPFYNDLTTKNEVQVLINESITSALNASY